MMNFAHVMMDIMMTEPPYAHLVQNSVKLVLEPQIIVSYVLKDMMAHQLVLGFQSPNQLKLKTSQLDLLKSLTVILDVKLVHQTPMSVYLVMLTEKLHHFAHVLEDTMKLTNLFVNFVVTDVLNV